MFVRSKYFILTDFRQNDIYSNDTQECQASYLMNGEKHSTKVGLSLARKNRLGQKCLPGSNTPANLLDNQSRRKESFIALTIWTNLRKKLFGIVYDQIGVNP